MRIAARDVEPVVATAPGSSRPIRLRTGALTYMFTTDEAIALATQLADAIQTIREETP